MGKYVVCQPNASGPDGAVFVVGQVIEFDSVPGYLVGKVRESDQVLVASNTAAEQSVHDDPEERDLRDQYYERFGKHAGGRMKKDTLIKKLAEGDGDGA